MESAPCYGLLTPSRPHVSQFTPDRARLGQYGGIVGSSGAMPLVAGAQAARATRLAAFDHLRRDLKLLAEQPEVTGRATLLEEAR
jgi:hypothetical protein